MRALMLIAHNVRSSHNVGSLLRTAEGLGVSKVYLTGYTPHPMYKHDPRLPYLAEKQTRQIHKTALGAEASVDWEHQAYVKKVINDLQTANYQIVALEQAGKAVQLPDFKPTDKVALMVGRQVEGLEPDVLALADVVVEIPMFGQKESFNVTQAAAMALYHCRFIA